MILNVSQLSHTYPPFKPCLKDLNFTAESGSLIHVTGNNGSGKTTLLRLLSGVLDPMSGTIEKSVGHTYIPAEGNGFIFDYSIWQNLESFFFLKEKVFPKDLASQVLSQFGFQHEFIIRHLPIKKLSTGMKKKASLARLILENEPLWILDEPINALDFETIQTFQSFLKNHLDQKNCAIISSHDDRLFQGLNPKVIPLT